MIRILVIDDNDFKRAKIVKVLERLLSIEEHAIDEAIHSIDGAKHLKSARYDLLILDVNIPMRKNESPDPKNGEELLRQIQMRRFKTPTHVIGLTAFPNLVDDFVVAFEEFTWSLVLFDQSSDGWEHRIANKLEHIIAGKCIDANDSFETDIAIVVALEDVEMKAILALEANWERINRIGDDTVYYKGEFRRDSKVLSVVVSSAIQMGMPAATGLAMKICATFRPRYLAMAGIAAGVKGNFGDILVADKAWDYGSGKIRSISPTKDKNRNGNSQSATVFDPAPTAISLDGELIAKIGVFCRNVDIFRQIEAKWLGSRAPTNLAALVGGIASGAAVIENRKLIDEIRSRERKVVGVDMEAYGIFLAARICQAPRPKAIVFKSICDFGDEKKDDGFQQYAAFTSARFLYEFALAEL